MDIKETVDRNTASVRLTTSVADLPLIIGDVYGEIMGHLSGGPAQISGPPFVVYRNMDMQALDVEIGFPVDRPLKGMGRVQPGTLPGGRVLSALHIGPYSTLEKTYASVMASMQEKGLTPAGWMYESYLNSPMDTPEAELRTEICVPLVS